MSGAVVLWREVQDEVISVLYWTVDWICCYQQVALYIPLSQLQALIFTYAVQLMFLLWKQLGRIVAEVGDDLLKFLDTKYLFRAFLSSNTKVLWKSIQIIAFAPPPLPLSTFIYILENGEFVILIYKCRQLINQINFVKEKCVLSLTFIDWIHLHSHSLLTLYTYSNTCAQPGNTVGNHCPHPFSTAWTVFRFFKVRPFEGKYVLIFFWNVKKAHSTESGECGGCSNINICFLAKNRSTGNGKVLFCCRILLYSQDWSYLIFLYECTAVNIPKFWSWNVC
jgi:hypothetical protein